MRILFSNWKYILKNLWFVLPFAILPAVFLALSLDYTAIKETTKAFFTGDPTFGFIRLFRMWSLIRVDSWVGALIGVGSVLCVSVCTALMLSLVEKHMRIGKRTLSGAFSQLGNNFFTALAVTVLYLFLYEVWAVVTAAILYAAGGIVDNLIGIYLISIAAYIVLGGVLFYCVTIFYLWLPCLQHTGFHGYEALRYSYQLMINVRGKLFISLAGGFIVACAVFAASAVLLPRLLFYAVAFVAFVFLYLSFCIRMETFYFATDKLDREDLIRSYREL